VKWKKASDHHPPKQYWYHVRNHHGRYVFYWMEDRPYDLGPGWVSSFPRETTDDSKWFVCHKCTNFEWLDESDSTQ
jgi:hypothetical protein